MVRFIITKQTAQAIQWCLQPLLYWMISLQNGIPLRGARAISATLLGKYNKKAGSLGAALFMVRGRRPTACVSFQRILA
jgi:hypothetical protein